MHKIVQSVGFLGRLLEQLIKTRLSLTKNVLKPLAKSVEIPARDPAIPIKIFRSGIKTLVFLYKEMNDIMKIVKILEESGLLIKDVIQTIKNKAKEQKGLALSMLLHTIETHLLGKLITGNGTIRAGEDTIRAGQNF